ncbi:hypothetical protein A7K91_09690 [Paenibacillus oryzae]|uniref:Peptidase M10 metallopeptidase domain-containing protein n=1 Tax=Paenibacillus oryzae TaxID=1844972 RepID=A0A1A5YBL1_9BACL|nr:hypothetical protein [Paenibacillus oryzae]OBR62978.1 hypothetical protein A7K91_09690 [Paenibacillus oryzae]
MKKKRIVLLTTISLLFLGSTMVSADYSSNHVLGGKNRTGGVFKYWLDSSVASYGYTNSITNAKTNWNAVPNAGIFLFETSDADDAEIKYYVTNNELGSGVFGAADFWDRNSNGKLSFLSPTSVMSGTNFDMTRIRLDYGRMTSANFTSAERNHNAGHETGHAMSLSHFEDYPAHTGNHWMKSGQISLNSPTSTDADHLVWKWPAP